MCSYCKFLTVQCTYMLWCCISAVDAVSDWGEVEVSNHFNDLLAGLLVAFKNPLSQTSKHAYQ